MEIITANQTCIFVDNSAQACQKFDFEPGKLIRYQGKTGIVLGVSYKYTLNEKVVVWFQFEGSTHPQFLDEDQLEDVVTA